MPGVFLWASKNPAGATFETQSRAGSLRGLFQTNTRTRARGRQSQPATLPAAILRGMALSPIRDRLMRGYASTRTLDRQADALRARMADLASDPSIAPEVLATIQAMRDTLSRAEQTARRLAAEQGFPVLPPS